MILFDQLFMVVGVMYASYVLVDFMVKFDYRIHRRRRRRKSAVWSENGTAQKGKFPQTKGEDTMEYNFVWVNGHVEVYDRLGRFCFSADTKREALEELRDAA